MANRNDRPSDRPPGKAKTRAPTRLEFAVTLIPFIFFVWGYFGAETWSSWIPPLAYLHAPYLVAFVLAFSVGIILKVLPKPVSTRFRLTGIFNWIAELLV